MASPLTIEDVRHIAHLSRLALTEQELALMPAQLSGILDHMSELEAIDTEGVEPMSHAVSLVNVFRDDVPGDLLDRQEVLSQAPDQDGERFRVPRILGDEG